MFELFLKQKKRLSNELHGNDAVRDRNDELVLQLPSQQVTLHRKNNMGCVVTSLFILFK